MGDSLTQIVSEFQLKPFIFCSQKRLLKNEINAISKIEILHGIFNDLVIEMRTELLKEFIEPDVKEIIIETIVTKNWFEHFKLEVFPKWLLKIFPANTKVIKNTYEVSIECIYPDIPRPSNIPYLTLYHFPKDKDIKIDKNKRQAKVIVKDLTKK